MLISPLQVLLQSDNLGNGRCDVPRPPNQWHRWFRLITDALPNGRNDIFARSANKSGITDKDPSH